MTNEDKKNRSGTQNSSHKKEDERGRSKGAENKGRGGNLTTEDKRRGGEPHGGMGK